jgi:hypothetical protein
MLYHASFSYTHRQRVDYHRVTMARICHSHIASYLVDMPLNSIKPWKDLFIVPDQNS